MDPSPIIPYASRPVPKPFPFRALILLILGPAAYLFFCLLSEAVRPDLVPPPRWFEWAGISMLFLTLLSTLAAILCLCILWSRQCSLKQRLAIAALSVGTLFAALLPLNDLLPSFGHPPYVRVMNNARRLALFFQIYAGDHEGHYPPHLAALLFEDPGLFGTINYPGTSPAIPDPPPPPEDWPKYAGEVDAHSVYIYTAADLFDAALVTSINPSLDPAIIIVYTKKLPQVPRHRILAFADGHAHLIPERDLPKYFEASNAARDKLGLPSFTLDGPAPPASSKSASSASANPPASSKSP